MGYSSVFAFGKLESIVLSSRTDSMSISNLIVDIRPFLVLLGTFDIELALISEFPSKDRCLLTIRNTTVG